MFINLRIFTKIKYKKIILKVYILYYYMKYYNKLKKFILVMIIHLIKLN